MEPECLLLHSQVCATCPYPELSVWTYRNKMSLWWGVVSTSPNPQAGGPPILGCPQLLSQYIAATLHIGGRSSIHNLRMHQAVVIGTHLLCICNNLKHIMRLMENTQRK